MIPKVHQRSPIGNLGWLLRYLFGPGENNERGGQLRLRGKQVAAAASVLFPSTGRVGR